MTEARSSERLFALARAAEQVAAPDTPLGIEARALFRERTGLSPEGVEYALSECLEVPTQRSVLSQLRLRAPQASAVHIVLSANVMTAAFRAIALGLAQSDRVTVRPSTREPTMANLLYEANPQLFNLAAEIAPEPGDHVWLYGADATIRSISDGLPAGVHLHAHGSGMGAAVVREPPQWNRTLLRDVADKLAQDVIAFDQRGCLSPRLLLLESGDEFCTQLVGELTASLRGWEQAVPRGQLNDDEAADAFRYCQTMRYVAQTIELSPGLLVLDPEPERIFIPPVGRHLHITRTGDPLARLQELAPRLTCVGFFHSEHLIGQCLQALGPRRYVDLGQMQKPALDGPVDLRHGWDSTLT